MPVYTQCNSSSLPQNAPFTSKDLSLQSELGSQRQLLTLLHASPSLTSGNGRHLAPWPHQPMLARPDQGASSAQEPPLLPCSSLNSQQAPHQVLHEEGVGGGHGGKVRKVPCLHSRNGTGRARVTSPLPLLPDTPLLWVRGQGHVPHTGSSGGCCQQELGRVSRKEQGDAEP